MYVYNIYIYVCVSNSHLSHLYQYFDSRAWKRPVLGFSLCTSQPRKKWTMQGKFPVVEADLSTAVAKTPANI